MASERQSNISSAIIFLPIAQSAELLCQICKLCIGQHTCCYVLGSWLPAAPNWVHLPCSSLPAVRDSTFSCQWEDWQSWSLHRASTQNSSKGGLVGNLSAPLHRNYEPAHSTDIGFGLVWLWLILGRPRCGILPWHLSEHMNLSSWAHSCMLDAIARGELRVTLCFLHMSRITYSCCQAYSSFGVLQDSRRQKHNLWYLTVNMGTRMVAESILIWALSLSSSFHTSFPRWRHIVHPILSVCYTDT